MPNPSAHHLRPPTRLRLGPLVLLLLLVATGSGLAAGDSPPAAAKTPIPLEERNHIEVAGKWYPVFEYPKEAEPTYDPRPRLPRKAKKEGRGGLVLLGVLIGREGRVLDTAVAMSNTEADIQEAAINTIRRWEFPIKHDQGKPIEYAVMIPVRFDATPFFGPQ